MTWPVAGSRIWWLWLLAAAVGSGCSESLPTASSADRRPYDDDARLLHPTFQALPHGSNDSVDLFLSMDRSELLYLREQPEAPFVARVRLTVGQGASEWVDTLAGSSDKMWRVRETWPLDSALQMVSALTGELADVHRGTSVAVRGSGSVPVFHADGWPIASDQIAHHTPLAIAAIPGSTWEIQTATLQPSLPAPPFSSSGSRRDSVALSSPRRVVVPPNGLLEIEVEASSLVLSNRREDGNFRPAIVLHGRRPDFPHVRSVDDLIECSRYITSRAEYERMMGSDDPKAALDAFWLDCADEVPRAKSLINTFYDRVEEANLYFSGLKEGWRTDRGMVHIVFGVPTKVRRYSGQEWWIYGEEGTPNAVTFRFTRVPNELDANHYELDRSVTYRSAWDRMVTSWRNGRIRGD